MSYIYKFLLDENGQVVYPRTVLSAVDVITANGIQISGDTMSVVFASKEQIHQGAAGMVISAEGLKEAISAYSDTLYIAGGGIGIKGGTVFAKAAPISSLIKGTPNENDVVTPANLNAALDIGTAANMTPPLLSGENTFTSASEYTEITNDIAENCLMLQKTSAANNTDYTYDWNNLGFVKSGSTYLIMADIKNNSSISLRMNLRSEPISYTTTTTPSLSDQNRRTFNANSEWRRIANLFNTINKARLIITTLGAGNVDLRVKHFCIFDVTGLTDEAIYALATMEHPERVYDRYLVKKDEVCPWVEIRNISTASTATIQAGLAYRLLANDGETHTLSVNTVLENAYGKDAYITIFVGDTTSIAVKHPLILMDPLTANAANNCVVKFRDGVARIYVTDTDYGYTVVVNSGSAYGSLKYGLVNISDEYITIAGTLDETRIDFDGAVVPANRKTNILGHGTDKTTLTGDVAPVATMEMHQLSLADVNVTGGTMIVPSGVEVASGGTLTAAGGLIVFSGGSIASGGTVTLGGGTLRLDSTNGNDAVIDCNGSNVSLPTNGTAIVSGCSFINGVAPSTSNYGGAISIRNATSITLNDCLFSGNVASQAAAVYIGGKNATMSSCVFTGNYASGYHATIAAAGAGRTIMTDCIISGNTQHNNGAVFFGGNATAELTRCIVVSNYMGTYNQDIYQSNSVASYTDCEVGNFWTNNGDISFYGSNSFLSISGNAAAKLTLTSDSVLDLTKVTKSSAVIMSTIMQTNVRILYNHDSAGNVLPTSSVTEISGGTYGGITNYGVLNGPMKVSNGETIRGNAQIYPVSNTNFGDKTVTIIGATFSRPSNVNYAIPFVYNGNLIMSNVTIGPSTFIYLDSYAGTKGSATFIGSNRFQGHIGYNVPEGTTPIGQVYISAGAIVDLTGIQPYGTFPVMRVGNGITFLPGGATVYPSAGQASAYMLDNVTVPKLRNDNVIDFEEQYYKTFTTITGCTINGRSASGYTLGGGSSTSLISSCTIIGCTAYNGIVYGRGTIKDCNIQSNHHYNGGTIYITNSMTISNTVIMNNTGNPEFGRDLYVAGPCLLAGGNTIGDTTIISNATVSFAGRNKITKHVVARDANRYGSVVISAGATIDLTGNATNPVIRPGSGITVQAGGATVITSSGDSYILDNVQIPSIGNTKVIDLEHTHIYTTTTCHISGCTFTNGYNDYFGGAIQIASTTATLENVTIKGNTVGTDGKAGRGGGIALDNSTITLNNCIVTDNTQIGGNASPAIFAGNSSCIININGGTYGGIQIVPLTSHSITVNISGSCRFTGTMVGLNGGYGPNYITISDEAEVYINAGYSLNTYNGGYVFIDTNIAFKTIYGTTTRTFSKIGASVKATAIGDGLYGATVTVPSDNNYSYTIHTTNGDVTVNKSNSPYVISGRIIGW